MAYDAHIERLGHFAVIDLKGKGKALADWKGAHLPAFPDRPNTASSADGLDLCWIGIDHWLLRGPLDREDSLQQTIDPASAPPDISAILVSDTLAFFSIAGPDAEQILAIVSPLDAGAQSFPQNGVTYSEAFGLKALIMRRPEGFELAVERSYGDMTQNAFARIKG